MTVDLLGPASTNAVTTRPASTTSYGTADTWFKACSSPAAQDGTQITCDWLNFILAQFRDAIVSSGIVQDNGDDMLWRVFEVMAPRYADDSGAANALVITDTPPIPAMRSGLMLAVKVLHNNTGASTITFDGETAVPIVHFADASALTGGELVGAGVALMVGDDAGNMRLINSAASGGGGGGSGGTGGGLAAQYDGLVGSAPGGTFTASWTVQEICAEASLGGSTVKGANLTLNFNGTTSGANGMDTGSIPDSSDFLVYAIVNPTGGTGGIPLWATLGCPLASSPGAVSGSANPVYGGSHMPAGYAASALIYVGKTDSSGHLVAFNQVNREICTAPVAISFSPSLVGSTTNTEIYGYAPGFPFSPGTPFGAVSLAAQVPAPARKISGTFGGNDSGQTIASTSTGIGPQSMNNAWTPFYNLMIVVPQTMYAASGNSDPCTVTVTSYTF